jgi:hypothetical protein
MFLGKAFIGTVSDTRVAGILESPTRGHQCLGDIEIPQFTVPSTNARGDYLVVRGVILMLRKATSP